MPLVNYAHLESLIGPYGLFEHAEHELPRLEHGFSLDDQGRALVVAAQSERVGLTMPGPVLERVSSFVKESHELGWRDRRAVDGSWNRTCTDDALGRTSWGLGEAAKVWPEQEWGERLMSLVGWESEHWRPAAYALSGWAAWYSGVGELAALEEIERLSRRLPRLRSGAWKWPEDRLTYDNARLPAALLLAARSLKDDRLLERGLSALGWLLEVETGTAGFFSFTPVGGRGLREGGPAFDQQPIEAWAMADAGAIAWDLTADRVWLDMVDRAVHWLCGSNDSSAPLYDPETGAGFDGLTRGGANQNQGCESTLAALGVLLAERVARLPSATAR